MNGTDMLLHSYSLEVNSKLLAYIQDVKKMIELLQY